MERDLRVLAEFEARHERLRGLAGDSRHRELTHDGQQRDDQPRSQTREAGLRAIERHRDLLEDEAGERLEELVREHDPLGIGARYLAAVGDPAYDSAFGKLLMDPMHGHLRFGPAEVEAVRAVSAIQAERALSLTGASGGFAVPFALDPTVMLTSDGALNPLREISRVETIAVDEWRGVSSAGVTAAFAAEATAATDNAPTPGTADHLDGEGAGFRTVQHRGGDGLDGPAGSDGRAPVRRQGDAGGDQVRARLRNQRAAGRAGRTLQQPEGPDVRDGHLRGRRRLAAQGRDPGQVHPRRVDHGQPGNPGLVLPLRRGRQHRAAADAEQGRIVRGPPGLRVLGHGRHDHDRLQDRCRGDFKRGYTIVDRIGLQIELVPHLFDATTAMPTGQRGLYAYWRVGAEVVNQNALRFLETK